MYRYSVSYATNFEVFFFGSGEEFISLGYTKRAYAHNKR
jgi:hypothetical protein